MAKLRNIIRLLMAAAVIIATMDARVLAQGRQPSASSSKKEDLISLNLTVPQEKISLGQKVWVSLTVKNLGKEQISYPESRVHVDGERDEPPTTLRQRQLTHTRHPGEPSILGGGFEPAIEPGGSFTRKYELSQLYDLSRPGRYTVYIDVLSESNSNSGGGEWIRSPKVQFEIQPPSQ